MVGNKTTWTFFLAIPLLLFSDCKKVDKLTQFTMDYSETIVIPSSTGINLPFNILTPDIQTNSASTFASHNTHKDLVEDIRLTKLELSIQSPEGSDFGFLKSVNLFIVAEGLAETKVAWKENIPSDIGPYLNLDLASIDLKEYIKKDKYTLRLQTTTDELVTQDQTIRMHSSFYVDAKILGQ